MSSPSFGQPVEERPAARTSGQPGNQAASKLLGDAIAQVQRVIVGQEHMVEQLMVALLGQGPLPARRRAGRREDAGGTQLRHRRRR